MKEPPDDTRHVTALEETLGEEYFAEKRTTLRMEFAAAFHRGRLRSSNEDQYVAVRRRRNSQVVATSLPAGHRSRNIEGRDGCSVCAKRFESDFAPDLRAV